MANSLIQFLQSKIFLALIVGVFCLALLAGTFTLGVVVGERKAEFSYAWGANYQLNFAGPSGGFFHEIVGTDFTDAHGTFGQILQIDGSTLIVRGRDGIEKNIQVSDDTSIRRLNDDVTLADLHANDFVVIIGEPNDSGQIEAKLIRVIPPTPTPTPAPY